MSRPQHSKRDRGRAHVGLPPKRDPKYGYCGGCGQPIHNRGAHAEACTGPFAGQRPSEGLRSFTGRYQCPRCLDTHGQGGLCPCGGRRFPTFRVDGAA